MAPRWLLSCILLSCLVILSPAVVRAEQSLAATANISQILRFWFDDYAFGTGETLLLEEAISNEARAQVAGRTPVRFLAPKGFQLSTKWDVYWTGHSGCLAAFKRRLGHHQLVNCLPGTEAITEKARLFATLEAAYGGALAATIVPLSFELPRQYFQLAHMLKEGMPTSWALKEEVHQGKGVQVVPASALLRSALQRAAGKPKFRLAQQLVTNQLLIKGCSFYVRAWILVFGSNPVRAYLFDGGVVVFGQRAGGGESKAEISDSDLIVNLWRQDRAEADPWSLQQLWEHLDAQAGGVPPPSKAVWQQMELAAAATVAAAVPAMRKASAGLRGYRAHSSGFAVFGADFVLDATLKPWLIEMNALPSLARKVIADAKAAGTGASTAANPFDEQKQRFLRATLQILLTRHAVHLQQQGQEGSSLADQQGPEIMDRLDTQLALDAARSEAATAAANGFAMLTPLAYRALDCLAAGRANTTCGALAGLHAGMPSRSQSSACGAQRLGWLDSVREWLGNVLRLLPHFRWGISEDRIRGRVAPIQLSELDLSMACVRQGVP